MDTPISEKVSAHNGQWSGMRVQVARTVMGLTHEILRAVGDARITIAFCATAISEK